uniref:Alpha-1,3-mannosyl-glycoprotein 2-beta-N-acetylglucosaminyltransferase n=1 Tax=Auxenochlorella protothecoides TaxID=3075 RepID=A0A1D2AAN0_AUXPR
MARRDPPYASLLTGTLCLLIFVELVWVQLRFASVLPGNQRDAVNSVARDVGVSHAPLHQDPPSLLNPAIIVFCYDRPGYLNQTLTSLAALPELADFTLYISQDGNHTGVQGVIETHRAALAALTAGFESWQRPRVPQLGPRQPGHAWLAQHYKWGLDRLFLKGGHSHAVIVEDDMLFSPDFLTLFMETGWLLDADPTLWCISSWNDNGFSKDHHWDPTRLFRTSYFPGLGWMLSSRLWEELGPAWPQQHWDHWMRMEGVARGRDCVVPEVNRNRNIGEVGANMDRAAFRKSLQTMGWAREAPAAGFGDVRYLLQPAYDAAARAAVAGAQILPPAALRGAAPPPDLRGGAALVPYLQEDYARLARRTGVWAFPRGHYRFLTSVPWRGGRLLLADARRCDLLPGALRTLPTPGMRGVAAEPGVSCSAACRARGAVCSKADLHFLNTCAALMRAFPCPQGCSLEWGQDLPNMVAEGARNHSSPGTCYVTQQMPQCRGQAPETRRLCACVPPGTVADEAAAAVRRPRFLRPRVRAGETGGAEALAGA